MTLRLLIATLFLAIGASAAQPQRIVSGAPSITEMLYALGLGDRVVGVTEFCHYPPEVREKPKIGSYMSPSVETILSMRPDMVVVLEEHQGLAARLERVGLKTLAVQHNDLAGIYTSLRDIGEAAGVTPTAEKVVAGIQAELAEVAALAERLPRRKTMFVVGRSPGSLHDLVCVGRGSFLNELIELAGGENLFQSTASFYPKIGREEILARRPEVVVDMGDMSDTDEVTEAHRQSVAGLWKQELPDLPAVRSGRVYAVAEDLFVVPGPRVGETARRFLEMIHPEAAKAREAR